jgi:hypothetical protein
MDMESFALTSFLVDEGTETAVGGELTRSLLALAELDVPLQLLQLCFQCLKLLYPAVDFLSLRCDELKNRFCEFATLGSESLVNQRLDLGKRQSQHSRTLGQSKPSDVCC